MKRELTKQELFDVFDGKISKTCLVPDQSEPPGYMIQGKFCWIQTAPSYGEDVWNIFICNPKNMHDGLGQRRVNRIARILSESPTTIAVRMLNDECDVWVQGTGLILSNLKLLGIRKKRKYSQEQITARVKVLRGEE